MNLFFVVILTVGLCQPFLEIQSIPGKSLGRSILKVSGDSSSFVVTAFNEAFENYINAGGRFEKLNWTKFEREDKQLLFKYGEVRSLDITDDGKMIIASVTL